MPRPPKPKPPKRVSTLIHDEAARKNIPTAEMQSLAEQMEEAAPLGPVRYQRATPLAKGETRERDADLNPQIVWNGARIRLSPDQMRQLQETGEVEIGNAQLVWRGKDRQDWSDLVTEAPPLYIQEKVHPKAIIDDLVRRSKESADAKSDAPDLFGDFNGLDPEARTEFYQHDQHWSNRMILGDSLHVMASLAAREGLKGKVQCIYLDPPYGIKFNSNWQVSTQSRDVKDGKREDISREPEQVKAFRDTWKDGIHSYLTYLRDRLTVARELLTESGSIFVQIGDENVHRVRALMDEVFGEENACSTITVKKTTSASGDRLSGVADFVVWYAKSIEKVKYRRLLRSKEVGGEGGGQYTWVEQPDLVRRRATSAELETPPVDLSFFRPDQIVSQRPAQGSDLQAFELNGRPFSPGRGTFKSDFVGLTRLRKGARLMGIGNTLCYVRHLNDFPALPYTNIWDDTVTSGFSDPKIYVVQTTPVAVARCLLMTTDPGDLVLDPTCGSGTTAYVAEQWGRRWITIDTSRVALALARTRLMAARYPYYFLADTPEGRQKEGEVTGKPPSSAPTQGDLRQGFVYERAPHVTLKSIANNAEIDVIWEKHQPQIEEAIRRVNERLGKSWQEWEVPRELSDVEKAKAGSAFDLFWSTRIARQKEIDDSIARNADVEFLYDRPYADSSRVRVAGPFTVESLSPHRVVPADDEELSDALAASAGKRRRTKLVTPPTDFAAVVLENLRTAGVQQTEKKDAIKFTSLQPWPGEYVGAEATFPEGNLTRRAAVFIGPEFGTVSRLDLVAAAREASEARFDVLIACAFNYDAHASELTRLGPLPVLKAKMNPDLHMAEELKNTGKGNLFVVFGEPDIDIEHPGDGTIQVRVKGIDVFDPNTGEVRSGDTKSIAAWFIDTAYDEENFFVRHAYFLGANDPYKSLKTALKAEIDEEAWATLYRDVSRPFARPTGGRIAVKVINHFGDEVMKVFGV
jgi:adenine-specific DNA-methyltransferase